MKCGCGKLGIFIKASQDIKFYCGKCKEPDMGSSVKNFDLYRELASIYRKCSCGDSGQFFDISSIKEMYCNSCKTSDMLPICKIKGCNSVAVYGDEGKPPSKCFSHNLGKNEELCKTCYKVGKYFNSIGEKYCDDCKGGKGFCTICKTKGGFYINGNKYYKDCQERYEAEQYCSDCFHKIESLNTIYDSNFYTRWSVRYCNTVLSTNKFCFMHACRCGNEQATYGKSIHLTILTGCSNCKEPNMIKFIHNKCVEDNCYEVPLYGDILDKTLALYRRVTHCVAHKKDTMYDLTRRGCKMDLCENGARWGYPRSLIDRKLEYSPTNLRSDDIHLFCQNHAREDMVNIRSYNEMCPGPNDITKRGPNGKCPFLKGGNPKYMDGYTKYCGECFIMSFPKDPLIFTIKTKNHEMRIIKLITEYFAEYNFIHDKPLWTGGCDCTHRRRIDLRTLIGNTILAIEVDEQQHKQYDESSEQLRYDDLYMIFSGKWVFIRFNPDSYKNKDGKIVKPEKERLQVLKDVIHENINRIKSEENTELVEIHKLFFDNYT